MDSMRCIVRTPAREMCRGKGGAAEVPLLCTPAMGNSLVVKVHYTLGSRKC